MESNLYQSLGQVSPEDAGQIFLDHLRGFVRQMISEVMAAEVKELCGPKHKPSDSVHFRAGSSSGRLLLEGERETVVRPRVRKRTGDRCSEEVVLTTYEAACDPSQLQDSIVTALMHGVSTRDFQKLKPKSPGVGLIHLSSNPIRKHHLLLFNQLKRVYKGNEMKLKLLVILAAALTVTSSSSAQDSKTRETESGVVVVRETSRPYRELPEAYRKSVSRADYDRMMRANPSAAQVVSEIETEKAYQNAIVFSIRNLNQAIHVFEVVSDNKELAEDLMIVPQQIEDFESLRESYDQEKRNLAIGSDAMAELNAKYAKEIASILLPFQLAEIGKWRATQIGTSKLLTVGRTGTPNFRN